jgi:hypothetical protein
MCIEQLIQNEQDGHCAHIRAQTVGYWTPGTTISHCKNPPEVAFDGFWVRHARAQVKAFTTG